MKNTITASFLSAFLIIGISATSQKYKTVADTAKLNKEYLSVTKDISDLTSELNAAQSKLPGYESKASDATSNAQKAATNSSDQASKATSGSVSDARSAKRKAKRAYKEAKDARSAEGNVDDQQKKIKKLNAELSKKQDRLHELDGMRTAIGQAPVQP